MYVDYKSQIERSPHQTMTNIIGHKDTKKNIGIEKLIFRSIFFLKNNYLLKPSPTRPNYLNCFNLLPIVWIDALPPFFSKPILLKKKKYKYEL